MGMEQKNYFFEKKDKIAKLSFSKLPILKKLSRRFHILVLGLIGLIDAKGIDMAQQICSWGCLT